MCGQLSLFFHHYLRTLTHVVLISSAPVGDNLGREQAYIYIYIYINIYTYVALNLLPPITTWAQITSYQNAPLASIVPYYDPSLTFPVLSSLPRSMASNRCTPTSNNTLQQSRAFSRIICHEDANKRSPWPVTGVFYYQLYAMRNRIPSMKKEFNR
jgi:hypothetical protein